MNQENKAVVTVIGCDTTGIIAGVSAVLAKHEANIQDIAQTVLSGMFTMMMIVDISKCSFAALDDELTALGEKMGLQIRIQKNEIFNAMHRI